MKTTKTCGDNIHLIINYMETTKTITERATELVSETTINYEYEHTEGAVPTQIKANVMLLSIIESINSMQ